MAKGSLPLRAKYTTPVRVNPCLPPGTLGPSAGSRVEGKPQYLGVKLPAEKAGLPGKEVSLILCPLTPPILLWRDGARSGRRVDNPPSVP
jgi:hypothetical protein